VLLFLAIGEASVNIYTPLLLVAELISSAAFAYLTVLFIRVCKRVRLESVMLYTIFITFLLLSQICAALSIVVPSARLATALYIASSSLALAGFIALLSPFRGTGELYIFLPLLITSPDILAGVFSTLLIVKRVRGRTRHFLSILSTSYYIRGLGALLTAFQGTFLVLLVSEAVRACAAVLLALHHTAQVLVYGKEEEG